ncbi:hypothetical protein ACLB1E_23935 [Escherichia coli]
MMLSAPHGSGVHEPSTFLTLLTSTHSDARFNDPAYDKVLAQASTENTVNTRNAVQRGRKNPHGASTDCTNLSIYQWTINGTVAERLSINNPEDEHHRDYVKH